MFLDLQLHVRHLIVRNTFHMSGIAPISLPKHPQLFYSAKSLTHSLSGSLQYILHLGNFWLVPFFNAISQPITIWTSCWVDVVYAIELSHTTPSICTHISLGVLSLLLEGNSNLNNKIVISLICLAARQTDYIHLEIWGSPNRFSMAFKILAYGCYGKTYTSSSFTANC